MQQETLDKLARLHFEDEKTYIKSAKRDLSNTRYHKDYKILRENLLLEIRHHKEKLMFYKRQVPLKPKKYKNYLGLLYICPCCDSELFYDNVSEIGVFKRYNTYCRRCGQRLMWEDENGKV